MQRAHDPLAVQLAHRSEQDATTAAWLLPLLCGCAVVLLYYWMKPGFFGNDDIGYALHAWNVLTGSYSLSPAHNANRFGVFVPTAFIYAFLGVNRYSSTLWPLLCAVITAAAAAAAALRYFGLRAAVLTSGLLVLNPLQLSQTSVLLPDLIVGTFILAAVLLLLAARASGSFAKRAAYATAAAATLALGMLTKTTVLWILPFLALMFLTDVVSRRSLSAWWPFCLSGAIAATLYFLAYYLATGDPFYVLTGIEAGHNQSFWSYSTGRAGRILPRLTSEFIRLLVNERGFFLLIALALPCVAVTRRIYDPAGRPTPTFFTCFGLTIVACFWFGTTSLRAYNPLPLIARMLAPAIPPLAIAAGAVLDRLYFGAPNGGTSQAKLGWIASAPLAVTAVLLFMVAGNVVLLYAASAALLLVPLAVSRLPSPLPAISRHLRWLCPTLLLASLGAYSASFIARHWCGETNDQRAERLLSDYVLASLPTGSVVVTSERSALVLRYYNGFRVPDRIKVRAYPDRGAKAFPLPPGHYALVNEMREEWFARVYHYKFRTFVAATRPSWELLIEQDPMKLYRARPDSSPPLSPRVAHP